MNAKQKVDVKQDVGDLKEQLHEAQEQVLRAQADYQNLVRRNQEERAMFAKFAHRDLVEALLQPLDHLQMAAAQINDKGLDMVVNQFQNVLQQFGLEEIECVGKEFDVTQMEAVGGDGMKAKGRVSKVQQKGYKLHGEVIRHAKVVI